MNIAIIGTGGVGGYFGGKLAQAGNNVTFLARGKHLEALKTNGLKVNSIAGDFQLPKVIATDKINEIGKVDMVILGIKSWQVKEMASDLIQLLHNETIILPLQNGVLAAEELSKVIDEKHIIGGLCRIFSKIESPGVIRHMGINPTITFGELNGEETERVQNIQDVFEKAQFKSVLTNDIQAELWKKFIAICTSAVLALTQSTYGQLLEIPETRQMLYDVMHEIYQLSQELSIKIEPDYVEKTLAFMETFPYNTTSSLTRDVWEGKPSELEYQNGTVVKLALKYNVKVPLNNFVYNALLPQEKRARQKRKI